MAIIFLKCQLRPKCIIYDLCNLLDLHLTLISTHLFFTEHIYEPWTCPLTAQKHAGCVIGVDYPKPIVNHAVIHKVNMDKMKTAYAANKSAGGATKKAAKSPKKAEKKPQKRKSDTKIKPITKYIKSE